MDTVFDALGENDVCATLILAAVLYQLGSYAVQTRDSLRQFGLRIGAGVFLLFCGFEAFRQQDFSSGSLLTMILRGLLLAVFATSASWLVLSVAGLVVGRLDNQFSRTWRRAGRHIANKRDARQREEMDRQRTIDFERSAPERERVLREAHERTRLDTDAKKRREDARLACEVLYRIHQPEIKDRFAPSMFDDYVKKHLGDNCPPDAVDERAQQLQQLIQHHAEKVTPAPKFRSMADLISWFEIQHKQLEAIPDDRLKATMLVRLKARYADLTVQVMEEQAT
jgi:hypothetical protein